MVRPPRNVKVDVWEPCCDGRSIDDFIRNVALPRCPNFLVCHNRWLALGAPDLDTSHWPHLSEMEGLSPRNWHDLLRIMNIHTELFIHRVARYWAGDPLPDMTLDQMAPFVVIELTISADLEVQEKMRHMHTTTREQLFTWCQSVNRRLLYISHFVRRCIDSCVGPNGPHNCLLRVCFGELYDEKFQAEVFADWFRRTQLSNPHFGTFASDAAHAESPTQWIIPGVLDEWLRGAPNFEQYSQVQYPTYIAEIGGEGEPSQDEDSSGTNDRQVTVRHEVLNSPARIDLFKLLCDPSEHTAGSRHLASDGRTFEQPTSEQSSSTVHAYPPTSTAGSPPEEVDQTFRHTGNVQAQYAAQQHSATPATASSSAMSDRRDEGPRRDSWTASASDTEGTHRPMGAREIAWAHHVEHVQKAKQKQRQRQEAVSSRSGASSSRLPPRQAGAYAGPPTQDIWGQNLFHAPQSAYGGDRRLPHLPPAREWQGIHQALPTPDAPEGSASASRRQTAWFQPWNPPSTAHSSPPAPEGQAKVKRRRSQDLVVKTEPSDAFAETNSVDSEGRAEPKTPADRAQQSREKMRRYAARVKRQREALTTMCEDLDHHLGPLGSHRVPYRPNDATPEPGSPGVAGAFNSPTSASKLEFASASEKLNFQKRASKARKRSSEQEQMERLSTLAESLLAILDGLHLSGSHGTQQQKQGSIGFPYPVPRAPAGTPEELHTAHIVEATFRRHTGLWDDLAEAEKRLRGTARSSGGGSAPSGTSADGPNEADDAHRAKKAKHGTLDPGSAQAGPSRSNPGGRWVQRLIQRLSATSMGEPAFSR